MKIIKLFLWALIFVMGNNKFLIPIDKTSTREYREAVLIERYFISKHPCIAKKPKVLKEIRSMIYHKRILSEKYGIDYYLELTRPMHESERFRKINSLTKGKAGETGWEQIMPKTGKMLGYDKKKLKILKFNLECGSKFYSQLVKRYKGDYAKALAYYNGGGKFMKIPDAIYYSNRVINMRNDLVSYLNKYL